MDVTTKTNRDGWRRCNRVRAVVTLSTGAVQEMTEGEWRESLAHRSQFYASAERADRLVKEILASKQVKVTWPALGVSVVAIDVYVDEREGWVVHHEIVKPTLHARHQIGGA